MAIEPAAISANPAITTMLDAPTVPDNPAARANGTVRPSAIPMTTSRTNSEAVKCFSTCGVSGIFFQVSPSVVMIVRMRTTILLACIAMGTLHAQNNLTTAAVQRYFNPVRRNLEASAEVMPAEKYGFRLTPGQMTFAEWINHSSERNYPD